MEINRTQLMEEMKRLKKPMKRRIKRVTMLI